MSSLPAPRVKGVDASGSQKTDLELVNRCLDGDSTAFELLYRRHAPVVGRRLKRLVYPSDEALDLLQLTFVEAHRSLSRWRPEAPFEAWLHGIAFRVAGNYIKARRRKWWQLLSPFGSSGGDSSDERPQLEARSQRSGPDDQAAHRELVKQVYAVLDELPVNKRLAFCMYEFEGLELAEIGKAMGASAQTTWARVESARKELRARLGYTGEASSDDSSTGPEGRRT